MGYYDPHYGSFDDDDIDKEYRKEIEQDAEDSKDKDE